ncbi:ribonuclease P protein component [Dactylosporangium matsuzakiense]|uniref:Ribonuclease P protein component n=1 Tax=Dactylosporangium matsuzakiense TaxID=53360 RepID=A0A9W6KCQ9_9ACTN|nr:ribonuclease P protein component [Dactylosporangium matsuzakiense]UWZ45002.1 ribonuclease P protein component [Dactylosporangium matsuzakiense]GLK99077.1 ribonuclease P protein component [Dactylosporangium matsuzakiense]
MLAAAQRLRRREDFAATIRNGRRAGRGAVVVHFLNPGPSRPGVAVFAPDQPVSDDSPARAGFVVSKAVGNAVVRNTVKRRLRHLVRSRLAGLPPGSVIVVRALPEAAGRTYQSLEEDLDSALEAARRPKSRGARR